jgi:hypothetical protein
MAKRTGQDNLEDILKIVNIKTKVPRQSRADKLSKYELIIADQKKVIEFMQQNKPATRKDLEKLLNLEFSKHPQNSKQYNALRQKFYRRMSPLLQTVITSDREENLYNLSNVKFQTWFDSLRRTATKVFE